MSCLFTTVAMAKANVGVDAGFGVNANVGVDAGFGVNANVGIDA